MRPTLRIESLLWRRGVGRIAGIDEAGRGAWAGPVVAAAVVFPKGRDLPDTIRDSKELSPPQRARAERAIREIASGVGVGVVPASIVDEFGLSFAGQLAFWRAVWGLPYSPEYLLVDGFPLWSRAYPQLAIIDGDARTMSVAAASIVAKVVRDRIMRDLDQEEPGYGFRSNVGYGTAAHRRALDRLGPSPHHRRSFQPVAEALRSHA